MISRKRKPPWACDIIEEAKILGVPEGTTIERKNPKSYPNYMAFVSDLVDKAPTCFENATKQKEWVDAMVEEYQSIIKNDMWEIVSRPKDKSVVSLKWIFKTNHSTYGSIEKYKEISVAHGISQKEGIDYDETFAPVARYTSIRTILSLASNMEWKLHQMDVKETFLNGLI